MADDQLAADAHGDAEGHGMVRVPGVQDRAHAPLVPAADGTVGTAIAASSRRYEASTKTLTFTPNVNLLPDTSYTVTVVASGIANLIVVVGLNGFG